jgi:hypothetical protein
MFEPGQAYFCPCEQPPLHLFKSPFLFHFVQEILVANINVVKMGSSDYEFDPVTASEASSSFGGDAGNDDDGLIGAGGANAWEQVQ